MCDCVLVLCMGVYVVKFFKEGIGGVVVGICNEKMVENFIFGIVEEGVLFSFIVDGKIVVNNLYKVDFELFSLNKSLL